MDQRPENESEVNLRNFYFELNVKMESPEEKMDHEL
jgi:hypothetical protein